MSAPPAIGSPITGLPDASGPSRPPNPGLSRYLPVVLATLGLTACAWPVALPASAWAWLLPVLALPITAFLLFGAAWPERRRAARALWAPLLLAAAAGSFLTIILVVWQARQAVALPRLFPRWWIFTLEALLVLSMAGIPWSWGRLLSLAVAQTILFVAAIEPAFGVHPAWAVVAGLLLLTGWGMADRTASRGYGLRILAVWFALSLVLLLLAHLLLAWVVMPGLGPLRAGLGLRPGPLAAAQRDRAGPDPGWLSAGDAPLAGAEGDLESEAAGSGPGEDAAPAGPSAGDAAHSGPGAWESPLRAPGVSAGPDAFPSWQVRLDDAPLDPDDRTPLVTVRLRRSWSGRVAQQGFGSELRLWKTAALDSFDGVAWEQSSGESDMIAAESGVCLLEPVAELRSERVIGQELLMHSAELGALPFVGRPVAVGGQIKWLLRDSGGALVPDGNLRGGRRFRVISVAHTGAGGTEAPPAPVGGQLAAMPRLLARARELGADAASLDPAAYLDRVLGDLRARCTYGMTAPLPGDGAPVEGFLFEARPGSCEHFATAFALLARAAGIPARLAVGFLAPAPEELERGPVTLTRAERHAWVEVWLADRGWVAVDPSPGGSIGAVRGAPDAGLPAAWRRPILLAAAGVGLVLFAAAWAWLRRRASVAAAPVQEPLKIVVRVPARVGRAGAGAGPGALPEEDRRVMLLHRRVVAAARWLGMRQERALEGARPSGRARASIGAWEELRDRLGRGHPPLASALRAYDRAWRRALFGPDRARAAADLELRAGELLGRLRGAGRERASLEQGRQRA